MTQPVSLSICIPVYNFGEYLGDTLASILPQLPADGEIVIVDGASTDATQEVAESHARRDQRIAYHRLPAKGGIDADLAEGVRRATGEYCWLFSGDDIMRPGAVARLQRVLQGKPDVVLCKHTDCSKDMKILGIHPVLRRDRPFTGNIAEPQTLRRYLAAAETTEALFSFMSGIVVRRSVWNSVQPPSRFMSSCWGHVARLLEIARSALVLRYVPEVWLDKRGENDSFLDKGVVNRLRITVDGYLDIAEAYFGKSSFETRQVRRMLRRELGVSNFLEAKYKAQRNPSFEDETLLERLFFRLYAGFTMKQVLQRRAYQMFPLDFYPALDTARAHVRRVARTLRSRV